MATKKRRSKRGTGTVFRAGRTWAIKYVEDGVRKYVGGYPDKDAATQGLASIVANIKAGLPGAKPRPKRSAPTFRELVPDWLKARQQLRSWRDDKNRYQKHLEPLLNHLQIDRVDVALLDELVADLRKVLAPAGVERVIYTLSAFYRWAKRLGKADANPVANYLAGLERVQRNLLRSQHDPTSTPYLKTKANIVAVFQKLPEPVNIAYALSALAGLRPGETVAVQWDDIDLESGRLTVRRSVRHGRVTLPKSGKPRNLSMVPSLVTLLTDWRERNPDSIQVIPVRRGHLSPKSIRTPLEAALKALKLPAMTFYQAGRHTFASQWVLAGLDIYRLSKILGHSSVTTTQRYAHLNERAPEAMLLAADVRLAG